MPSARNQRRSAAGSAESHSVSASATSGWSSKWPLLAVILAGLVAYANSFSGPFLYDDLVSIVDNGSIQHWRTALFPPAGPIVSTVSGRPILNLSLAVNAALSGTAVGSYHALNLLIHLLAGLTLFGLVRRTLLLRDARSAVPVAGCVALLWTLHPLQTESVTYIIQRAESLMGLCYLLALYGFVRGAQSEGARRSTWFIVSLIACLFGMAIKEAMVSAPLVILLYDRAFLAGSFREALRRRGKIYAGLAATWVVLAGLILSTQGRQGVIGLSAGATGWNYALTQFPAIVHYLRLSVWPSPLVFDYGTALAANFGEVWPQALVILALVIATGWALVRRPALGLLAFGFFAILAPSSSVVPIATEPMAEHRMYLPLIAVVVLAVLGLHRILGRAALPVCLGIAAVLGGLTARRNEIYRSELSLWRDTVIHAPANPRAHLNLAVFLAAAGNYDAAIAEDETALRLKPDYAQARENLGKAHYNLGLALAQAPGRLKDAVAHYEIAVRFEPDNVEAHNNLGTALVAMDRLPEAIVQFEAALRLKPDAVPIHCNLAFALMEIPGRANEAKAHLQAALQLDPANQPARQLLDRLLESPR